MLHKRFSVKITLNLHAISCPGVWLCTHGYLEATIKTLGYYFRTGAMEPRFPLLCHDQFTMEGYFKTVGSMDELERVLAAEQLEITLWQNGRRLTFFVGKLGEIMLRELPKLACPHNINVQLLMKATPAFPGIIAPKVEMTAQVGMRDRSLRRNSIASLSEALKHLPAAGHYAPFRFHTPSGQPTGDSCANYADERRRQKPVCHAKEHFCGTCSGRGPSKPRGSRCGSDPQRRNDCRRLSTCSSHFSSASLLSHMSTYSQSNNSYCAHSTAGSLTGGKSSALATSDASYNFAPDVHRRHCDICQSYKELFACVNHDDLS